MSTRLFRNSWWVDFRHEEQRIRKRSPENSRAGAAHYEAVLRQRLARGQPLIPPVNHPAPKPRFEAFAWRWFHTYVETNNKPSDQKTKRLTLQNHLIPAFGTLRLNEITPLKIEEFKAAKLKAGLAPKTINNLLFVLGKCLRTATEWGELDGVPKIKLLKEPPPKFDFLSPAEANQLIASIEDPHWHAMVIVALRTGLRIGELMALDWADVNLERRLLTVRQSIFEDQIGSPKSNRLRHIPLTEETVAALTAIRQPTGRVFRPCARLNHSIATSAITAMARRAGLRRIGWHVLRHTFASQLVLAGVSVKAVQELLGHADIHTTMRYAHLAPSALQDAIRVLEPRTQCEPVGQPEGNAPTALMTPHVESTRIIKGQLG